MGSVSRENDVLKLVYPGRFVEIYKSPITAAQVMERNPRHCVTRPDVFKFPWIVVRPESVLKPGRIFYVVPYHTIHRLLQSKGYRAHEHEQDFNFRISPRTKIDYNVARDDQFLRTQLHDYEFHRLVKKGNSNNAMESQNKVYTMCEDSEPESTDSPGSTYTYQNKFYMKESVSQQLQRDSNVESPKKQQVLKKWQKYKGLYENDDQQSGQQVYSLNENLKVEDSLATLELKSCLKKHTNVSKSRGFRVRFALDDQDSSGSMILNK